MDAGIVVFGPRASLRRAGPEWKERFEQLYNGIQRVGAVLNIPVSGPSFEERPRMYPAPAMRVRGEKDRENLGACCAVLVVGPGSDGASRENTLAEGRLVPRIVLDLK